MAESQLLEPSKKEFMPVTSKAQWIAIEERLKRLFASLNFEVDGHVISVQRHFNRENSSALYVYIDGCIEMKKCFLSKGEPDFDPIVKLVWRRYERRLWSNAKVDSILVKWKGNKKDKEEFRKTYGLDKTMVSYRSYFPTALSLCRQFRKIDGIRVEC